MRNWIFGLQMIAVACCVGISAAGARAQSPELSMREFSSGQIKKGVRSLGFGGDGATGGNYALVWRDADSALIDYGDTHYSNGNQFNFVAAGLNTPSLWHGLTIYAVAMFQNANGIRFSAKSPGLGAGAVSLKGDGTDQGIFTKFAMPLGRGFSIGGLLNYEVSQFDADTVSAANPAHIHYATSWRPSGGFGATWEPNKKLLFGFRGLVNSDLERRTDPAGTMQGISSKTEFRLGASVSPWDGAQIDAGATRLARSNALAGTHSIYYDPNLGFEQALLRKHLILRGGVDETSPTAGISVKYSRYKLDSGYVHDMAIKRVGNLFGANSQSILFTFTVDYGRT
jgi:hypothetical protein